MNRLTIVTLGTGGEAFLTRGVERALHEAPARGAAHGAPPHGGFSQGRGHRL